MNFWIHSCCCYNVTTSPALRWDRHRRQALTRVIPNVRILATISGSRVDTMPRHIALSVVPSFTWSGGASKRYDYSSGCVSPGKIHNTNRQLSKKVKIKLQGCSASYKIICFASGHIRASSGTLWATSGHSLLRAMIRVVFPLRTYYNQISTGACHVKLQIQEERVE